MPERAPRGVLDTSVVINLDRIHHSLLPEESGIAAITLAELAAGPHAATAAAERACRQDRLQSVERTFDTLPFDEAAARAYGRVYALVAARGRKARGARTVDLLIAATAASNGLPLYTCNPKDFVGLDEFVEIIAISTTG